MSLIIAKNKLFFRDATGRFVPVPVVGTDVDKKIDDFNKRLDTDIPTVNNAKQSAKASSDSAKKSAADAAQASKNAEKARSAAEAERQQFTDQFVTRQIAPPVSKIGEAVIVNAPTLAMLGG